MESKKMNKTGNRIGKFKKQRTGFTLVELLVVIAIIGILASMLMPAINSARESARSAQCGSNSRNIAIAANSYTQQNKDQLPMIGTGTNSGFVELLPYLEMSNLYDTMKNFQGVDDGTGTGDLTTYSAPKKLPIFVCPSAIDPDVVGQSNYAMNGGRDLAEFTTETSTGRGAFHPTKKTGVSLMAKDGLMNTIFYSEKQANGAVCNSDTNGGAFHGGKKPNDFAGMPPAGGGSTNDPFNSAMEPHAHSNHPGGVNAAFGDAHVGFYTNDVDLTHWQALTTANGREPEFAGSE